MPETEETAVPAADDDALLTNDAAQTAEGAEDAAEAQNGGEAADDMFSFTEDDAKEDAEGGEQPEEPAEGGEGEDGGGKFELSQDADIPQEYAGGLGKIAQELGVPGDKGARLIEQAWKYAKAQHAAENKRLGAELRKEWGGEFEAKVGATKTFAARMASRAGLSMEQMKPMMSPHGFRLLNAMREMVQEGGGFAGGSRSAPSLTTEQQIDQIYNTPELFKALTTPSDPRYEEVNKRLNKLMGIV